MIAHLAIFIPVTSFFIYAILLFIECGVTMLACWPALIGDGTANVGENMDLALRYVTPVWEATNVFLVFAIISLAALFPVATPVWGRTLIVPLFIFLVVVAARIVGMLYVFYQRGKRRAMKALLFVADLLAPAVLFGGVVPFFLTGSLPHNALTWSFSFVVGSFAAIATIVFGLLFLNYAQARGKHDRLPAVELLLGVLFFGIAYFVTAIHQLPYIIYPSFTITNSITDPQSAIILLGVCAVGIVITVPALALLYFLFVL